MRILHDDIFDLLPENINCFPKQYIRSRIDELLYSGRYSRFVEARDICYVLESNYSDMVLSALEYYDYSVYESVGVDNAKKLHERGIKYLASDEQKGRKYVPFENGYIHEEDKNYIIENKITVHEIARYTDGWYSCFPYPELFKTYDKNELKLNYLSILHTAMFARVLDREYIGDWHRLIGNILCFLKICDVEIEWEKLYEIFRKFLEVSLIYISQ